ncbi:hypothetical protein PIB30_065436 [Stylosanthes scabra]|uniref:Uncharacterized protein n=1 Tax=Stylosanthes scabra TaxID=79078 RepID=A0ABU6TLU7_9FABA|nr:hypothetical protein [Stylosanthes scabra]
MSSSGKLRRAAISTGREVDWIPYDAPSLQAIVPGDVAASHPSGVALDTTADGAKVGGILLFCKDGTTCGGVGLRADPVIPAPGVIPYYARDEIPKAPDMVQSKDVELPEVHPRFARRRRAMAGEVVDEDRLDQMGVQ